MIDLKELQDKYQTQIGAWRKEAEGHSKLALEHKEKSDGLTRKADELERQMKQAIAFLTQGFVLEGDTIEEPNVKPASEPMLIHVIEKTNAPERLRKASRQMPKFTRPQLRELAEKDGGGPMLDGTFSGAFFNLRERNEIEAIPEESKGRKTVYRRTQGEPSTTTQ